MRRPNSWRSRRYSGLPQVREVLAAAQARFDAGQRTLLFVDEVHRFNKVQQDAFLPHIERGTIVFVGGATTENPSFELNSALLSRCRVHAGGGVGRRHRHRPAARAWR